MSTKALYIASDFRLPLEAVTQTFAVLAKRGVGKTYTASVMAEEMLGASQQIVVIDPTGAWYGLRSSADGKGPGFPIVVAGGERGDIPLDEHAGELLAQAVVERRFSAVIDLSLFRKGQVRRFLTPFLETLYRLNREAIHLFVDEADDVCPQKPFGDEAQMVGAMEDVVKRGRRKGIGCTLITQRPADLAKQVLTQCEVLVAMRLVHPRDIAAIKEWVNVHAEPGKAEEMIGSLPSLPVGTAWFWSPGWGDFFQRVKVRERRTFDSSATPKAGQVRSEPKALAPVDVQQLGAAIVSLKEQAKANDPKELKRRVAELEKLLAAKPAAAPPEKVEVPVVTDAQVARVEKIADRLEAEGKKRVEDGERLLTEAREFRASLAKAVMPLAHARPMLTTPKLSPPTRLPTASRVPRAVPATTEGITPRQQRMLNAAATLTTLGVEVSRETVCGWLGIHPRGGSVGEELKALAEVGLIDHDRGAIVVTEAGMSAAEQLDASQAVEQAKAGLSPRQARIFDIIAAAYPNSTTREAIAEEMQIHPRGGSFGEDLGRLVGRGLIEGRRGEYRARDFLFAGAK